jgi:hypothetical protein
MAAPSANATTFNCVFSNGCGALHGVNAVGTPVAVDAKYKNPDEMAIGYPDLTGDSATNVALVAHTQHSVGTQAWADTALFGTDANLVCTDATSAPPSPPACGGNGTLTNNVGGSLTFTFTPAGPVALSASQSDSAVLPSGLAAGAPVSIGGGQFTVAVPLGTAVPNTYGAQSVTFNAVYPDGPSRTFTDTITVTFILKVDANHEFTPGPVSTFYTIVFAKNGFWSSQCLTEVGTVGKVRFAPCTLGHDPGQRFYAYLGGVPATSSILAGGTYSFQSGEGGGFLEDASVNPSPQLPQTDLADSILPNGRQLDVNGTNSLQANEMWTWGP